MWTANDEGDCQLCTYDSMTLTILPSILICIQDELRKVTGRQRDMIVGFIEDCITLICLGSIEIGQRGMFL
jgi:hypothetical protein